MTAPRIGAFGKVPTRSDFFRHNAGAPEVRALDRWLQDGLEHAPHVLGPRWRERYDETPPGRFIFQPPGCRDYLLGVAVVSGDAAGRRFPFSVFRLLSEDEARSMWSALPHAFADFLDAAERLGVDATRGATESLGEQVDGLSTVGGDGSGGTREGYADFIRRVSCAEFLRGIHARSVEGTPCGALRGLREVLRSVATHSGRGGPGFGLRAVLPDDVAAGFPELSASLWMDVVARALGPLGRPPLALWTRLPAAETGAAPGRLFLTPASARFLGCWLDPERDDDRVWDLVPPATESGTASPEDDDCRELVDAPLAGLLDRVLAWTRS